MSSLPTVGEQVIELVVWVGADAGEQVAEVGEGFDVLALAGCDQAGQDGPGSSAVVAAVEEPVVAAHHDVAEAALGAVIVDLQIPVFAVAHQRIPVLPGIVDGISDCALG